MPRIGVPTNRGLLDSRYIQVTGDTMTGALIIDPSLTVPLINGSSANNGDITINGTSSATKTTSYVILQATGGNVGIGTTGPGAKLQIISPTNNYPTSPASSLSLRQGSNNAYGWDWIQDDQVDGNLYFHRVVNSASTNVMSFMRSTGNVGIGTTVPTYLLSLGSEAAQKIWVERRNTVNNAGSNLTVEAGGSTNGMVATVAVVAAGNGYNVADVLTLATPSGGTAATCTVATLTGGAGTGVATVTLTTKGAKYTTGTKTTTVAPAGGTGCTISVATIESGTDKAGGTLYLDGGLSSGTGLSAVEIRTCPAGSTGATDNTLTTIFKARGDTLGLWGVTPVVRPTAYTQTYSTATKTHSNPVAATVTDTNGLAGFLAAADRTALVTAVNNLITDLANTKQVLNQVIDDLQGFGALQ